MKKIVKTVILVYFITITVEFLLISLNIIPTGIWSTVFQTYDDGRSIRPMGISSEPSYAAIIVVFSLYVLFNCDNFSYKPKEIVWYGLSILAIALSGSSYGLMLLAILLPFFVVKSGLVFRFLKFVRKNEKVGIAILIVAISGLFVVINFDNKALERLTKIYSVLRTSGGDIKDSIYGIVSIDNSASMRLLPTLQLIEYFKYADFTPLLFGRGAGQATLFYSDLYDQLTLVGFIPAFIYNYGLIGTAVTFFCLLPLFPKKRLLLMILFLLFLFNADFNTQIFAYILFVAMMGKQIEKLSALQNEPTSLDEHSV